MDAAGLRIFKGSPVNAQLVWFDNVSGAFLVNISLLLIGQLGLGHLFRHRPLLPIGWNALVISKDRLK
jgi:hypothetical protein